MEVKGTSDTGIGVTGESTSFEGVRGTSHAGAHGGVVGINDNNNADLHNPAGPGVYGESIGTGVWGKSKTWMGVYGSSESTVGGNGVMGEHLGGGAGVYGKSASGTGVFGEATGTAVWGQSHTWMGVYGLSESTTGGAGVMGEQKGGGAGVIGKSGSGNGGYFESAQGEGVRGISHNPNHGAVVGLNDAGGDAGFFAGPVTIQGNAKISGDVLLTGADCAEDFAIGTETCVDPGTVMVLGEDGDLVPSQRAYDKRVAGVISGAGEYRPAIILDKQQTAGIRQPVALVGKVYCKVDAHYSPIEVGDLLTTSPTTGHAMKAADATKSHGSVIGKALKPMAGGQGLLPILISLQ